MSKYKTFEDAEKAYDAKKKESRTAYDALKEFEKENKLGFGKESKDKKVAAEHSKLKSAHKALKAELEVIETAKKELKPPTERSSFVQKYEYPLLNGKEMTADEKKSYRRKARAAAKAGKPMPSADEVDTKKSKKEDEKPAKKAAEKAPVKEDKKSKKSAKPSKKVVEDDDDDDGDDD